jgi:hypothetical protein
MTPPLPAALVRRRIGRPLCGDGQRREKLAYVYFEDEPGRRSAAKLLSKDEARRIAVNCEASPALCERLEARTVI